MSGLMSPINLERDDEGSGLSSVVPALECMHRRERPASRWREFHVAQAIFVGIARIAVKARPHAQLRCQGVFIAYKSIT